VLDSYRWSNEEYYEVCSKITVKMIEEFFPKLLENLFIEALIVGNVTPEEAKKHVSLFTEILKPKPLPKEWLKYKQHAKLGHSKDYVHAIPTFSVDDENSAIQVYLQMGLEDTHSIALLDLFTQASSNSAFNQLRTKEQLGYIVWAGSVRENGVQAFRVIVQSNEKDPVYLDERVDNWIKEFENEMEKWSDEEFANFRAAVIVQKLEKDKSLYEEYNRWLAEIQYPRTHMFNRYEEEAKAVDKLTKDDIRNFYKTFINGSSRRKLSVQIFGKGKEIKENAEKTIIKDYREFKKNIEFYPIVYDLAQDLS